MTREVTLILAGEGRGLHPLSSWTSRPHLPFGGGFRLIDFALTNCIASSLQNVYVITQRQTEGLPRHLVDRWNRLTDPGGDYVFIQPLRIVGPTNRTRGVACALGRELDLVRYYQPDVVLVLSADCVYRADYQRLILAHMENNADLTVLTGSIPDDLRSFRERLEVSMNGTIRGRLSEGVGRPAPSFHRSRRVDLKAYCVRPGFLADLLAGGALSQLSPEELSRELLDRAVRAGSAFSCPLERVSPDREASWREMETVSSYFDANMELLRTPVPFRLADPRWLRGSPFHRWLPRETPVPLDYPHADRNLVSRSAVVGEAELLGCVVSPGVRVESDASLEECILLPGSVVESGARLRRVIVDERARVPSGMQIGFSGGLDAFSSSGIDVFNGVDDGHQVRAAQGSGEQMAKISSETPDTPWRS